MTAPDPDSSASDEETLDLFQEPANYYPPSPPPTTATHTLLSGQTLTVQLVGHNPLWGHHLWQAGRIISTYFESRSHFIQNKLVLELGAGAGLPSLVCALLGAKKVVVTDYPDPELVENLRYNIEHCIDVGKRDHIVAEGYIWGADPSQLLTHIEDNNKFDILILADLLFNHSEHGKLILTIQQTLSRSPDAAAYVFFTPYRPWLFDKDMAFFELVKEAGFGVQKILEEKMERVMFENDRGDEELRRTVFGYLVKWNEE